MVKKVAIEALSSLHGNVNYLLELRELARKNRARPTEAEEKIWKEVLRCKQSGYKFTRQKPISRFIVDFYCSQLNLAIEIDGEIHLKNRKYDEVRDEFLKQIGINTIRFSNEEIIENIAEVKRRIKSLMPPLSRGGVSVFQKRRG